MTEDRDGDATHVSVRLGTDLRLARVARAVASACGAIEDYDSDALDDLRLLVDEVFHALTIVGSGPITLDIACDGALQLEMTAPRRPGSDWDDPALDMLHTIAEVVADEVEFHASPDTLVFRARRAAKE
jgi:hypothetical protein